MVDKDLSKQEKQRLKEKEQFEHARKKWKQQESRKRLRESKKRRAEPTKKNMDCNIPSETPQQKTFKQRVEENHLIVILVVLGLIVGIITGVLQIYDRYKPESRAVIFSHLQTYWKGDHYAFRYGYSTKGTVTEVYTKTQVNAIVSHSGSNEEHRYDWVKGPFPPAKSGEIVYTQPDDWWTQGGIYTWEIFVVVDGEEHSSKQTFRYDYDYS